MKRLLSRKVIIILITAVVLLGGVGGAVFFLPIPTPPIGIVSALGAGSSPSAESTPHNEGTDEPGMMYPMKERVVNLADKAGFRYLKIEIVLEFDVQEAKGLSGEAYKKRQDEFVKEMASRRPILDDIVTTVLASKTAASISNLEGRETLREELKSKFDEVTGENRLLNVYFTQFIIQ